MSARLIRFRGAEVRFLLAGEVLRLAAGRFPFSTSRASFRWLIDPMTIVTLADGAGKGKGPDEWARASYKFLILLLWLPSVVCTFLGDPEMSIEHVNNEL